MLTATFQTTPAFNAGIRGLIHKVGLESARVVKVESGALVGTLINFTPPKDVKASKAKIGEKIQSRFTELGHSDYFGKASGMKASKTGVVWYAASESFLFGVTPQNDMRKAGKEQILAVWYRSRQVQGSARIVANFKHPRKHQRVAILNRVLTLKKQVNELKTRIGKRFGRMKAGWTVGVSMGKIHLPPSYRIPAWVKPHMQNARGGFEDGLGNKTFPTFTIINRAKGVGKQISTFLVQGALRTRAQAIQKNILYFMNGKKNLSDYAN